MQKHKTVFLYLLKQLFMASGILVRIPLKPFLVSYLETRYGPSPISFSGKGRDKDRIMAKLEKLLRQTPEKPFFASDEIPGITVNLTELDNFDPRKYNYLSPTACKIVEKYIYEHVFLMNFYDWMDQIYEKKDEIQLLIQEFCEMNNLKDKDISFETLKKRFYRYRASRLSEIRKKNCAEKA